MPETKRDQLDGLSQAMLAQYNRREDVSLPHCHDIMGRGTIEGSIIRRLEHAVADLDYQGRLEEPALPVPEVANLDGTILARIEEDRACFDMSWWHRYDGIKTDVSDLTGRSECGASHCRAGWAVILGGKEGMALQMAYGPAVAGALIYLKSTGRVPDFYCTDDEALADMRGGSVCT